MYCPFLTRSSILLKIVTVIPDGLNFKASKLPEFINVWIYFDINIAFADDALPVKWMVVAPIKISYMRQLNDYNIRQFSELCRNIAFWTV